MNLDCREYPTGYTFAEVASQALGLYVNVADFTVVNGKRVFRMITDAELTKGQMLQLIKSSVRDQHGVYTFLQLEAISGPVVDQGPRMVPGTHYLRITFM